MKRNLQFRSIKTRLTFWFIIAALLPLLIFSKVVYDHLTLLLISLVAIYVVAFLLAKNITLPVLEMTEVSKRIQAGDLSARNHVRRVDEFGYLAESFNSMTDSIISRMAVQQRGIEINETMVAAAELTDFGTELIKKLVEITDSHFGAFYMRSQDGSKFEHFTSIGVNPELLEPFDAEILEGEIGTALATKKISHVKDIPQDTIFKFKMVVGTALPGEIITIPIVVRGKVMAVISLGSLSKYSKETLEILNQTWTGMNTAFSNILALNDTEKERDKIDGILKSVADALIVTDMYNKVILMNRAAEKLLGVCSGDVVDRPIDSVIEAMRLHEKVRDTLDKKRPAYQFDFELPGDHPKHPRTIRARTSVIHDREARETGIVTIMYDVTHQREVDRMKTEFVSTSAYELRAALTSIQGFSEILLTRDDLNEEETKKFLSYIHKQAVRLAGIVSELSDISRIESGLGFTLNKVKYDAGDAIKPIPGKEEQDAEDTHS